MAKLRARMPRSSRYGEIFDELRSARNIATTCRNMVQNMAAHLRRRPREGVGVSVDWRQVGRAIGTEDALVVCHARQQSLAARRLPAAISAGHVQPKVLCVLDACIHNIALQPHDTETCPADGQHQVGACALLRWLVDMRRSAGVLGMAHVDDGVDGHVVRLHNVAAVLNKHFSDSIRRGRLPPRGCRPHRSGMPSC